MGCRWDVDLSRVRPEVADRLRHLWAHANVETADRSEPEDFPRELIASHLGDPVGAEGGPILDENVVTAPYTFSTAITLASIRAQSGRLTLLHSAALAEPATGAGVILVAESGTGKSTAARTLGRELGYLSDETAVIRDDLTLIGHPKPLSLIPAPGQPKIEKSPGELGLLPAPPDPWLAATILLCRKPGHGVPTLESVPLLEAMAETIPQSSALPTQDRPLASLARVLTAGAGVHRLTYAEIADAAPLIHALLAGIPRGSNNGAHWQIVDPAEGRRTEPWTSTPAADDAIVTEHTRITRAPYLDAIDDGVEVLVLNGPNPIRLLGLGSTIWRTCTAELTVAEATATVVTEHGEHPDAPELVAEAVHSLLANGLLETL